MFSALVLMCDQERQIVECLEHSAWCDERIVVDMQSRDRTPEPAERLGTKILMHDSNPHIDSARNVSIAATTGDWILVLDADEWVTLTLAIRLRECVRGR